MMAGREGYERDARCGEEAEIRADKGFVDEEYGVLGMTSAYEERLQCRWGALEGKETNLTKI